MDLPTFTLKVCVGICGIYRDVNQKSNLILKNNICSVNCILFSTYKYYCYVTTPYKKKNANKINGIAFSIFFFFS